MVNECNIIPLVKNEENVFSCHVPISVEQWIELLNDENIITGEWTRMLFSFYFMPQHSGSCTQCSEKYGYTKNTYNSRVSALGRAVIRRLGTFSIVDESGSARFWPVAMGSGREMTESDSGQFEWRLREELIEALRCQLIKTAIAQYISEIDLYWKDEEYKWRAVKWFQTHWDVNAADFASMLELATARTGNLLATQSAFPRAMIIKLAKSAPEEVRSMFNDLFDENRDLSQRVESFVKSAEKLRQEHGLDKNHYQNTNVVSTYLWLRYPEKYYIYKYGEYRQVSEKLGMDVDFRRTGQVSEMIKGFEMYDKLNAMLHDFPAIVSTFQQKLQGHDDLYQDHQLRTATIDFGFWVSRWYTSLEKSLYINNKVTMTPFITKASEILRHKKNIILQGAPGTGKTYNTAALALAIIDGTVPENRPEAIARYEQLRAEKRIGFTTFHQSMDYEDFIEGIKPRHEGDVVKYDVEDGIFKRMCEAAKVASEVAASGTDGLLDGLNENPQIWKVSLEGTGDNPTRRDCMNNGYIRIGWKEYGNIDFTEENPQVIEGKSILRMFQEEMKVGDIVVSCWSQNETDAIGIVTSDYDYREEGDLYPRYREVRWVVKGIKHDIREINNGKRMTLGTVYRLSISLNDILDVIKQYSPVTTPCFDKVEKPYVMIIDEINRGNVSKIFGELITLLEKDKRLGDSHPITLSLPYSKTRDFGVPQNLYIIGTMNTTDRSTGTIDYAIRRRFAFLTIPAERSVIQSETGKLLFDNVRKFITRYQYADMDIDDLMVGHSYFMAESDDELLMKMQYEVIPLIKEYIKDGILSVRPVEAQRYFESWNKLETTTDEVEGTPEG